MRKLSVPEKCYRPINARKSTCPDFSQLRPKNALRLNGNDMGLLLPKNERKSTSQYILFFWPDNAKKNSHVRTFHGYRIKMRYN